MPGSELLRRLLHGIRVAEDGLTVALVAGMVVLAVAQIALRNLWDSGLGWADPLLRVAVLWVGMLGALAATRDDRHIRVDLLPRLLGPGARRWALLAGDLFAAAVCGLLAWHAMRFVMLDFEAEVLAFNGIPAWPFELILPFGFALMTLRLLLTALRRFGDGKAAT